MKFLNDTTNPVCRTEELSAPVSQKKTVPKSALKKKQGTPAPVAVKQPNSAKKLQVYYDIPVTLSLGELSQTVVLYVFRTVHQ